MQTTEKIPAATVAYWTVQDQLKEAMATLQTKLDRHEQKQVKQPENYGFSGELAHVLSLINQINESLGA